MEGRTDIPVALCEEVGDQARKDGDEAVTQGQVTKRFRQPLGGKAPEGGNAGGGRGGDEGRKEGRGRRASVERYRGRTRQGREGGGEGGVASTHRLLCSHTIQASNAENNNDVATPAKKRPNMRI